MMKNANKSMPDTMLDYAVESAAQIAAEATPEFQQMKAAKANAIRSAAMQAPQEKVPLRESTWQMSMSGPSRPTMKPGKKGK